MRRATLESIELAATERGFSFTYAAVPLSYPLHGAFDFDPESQRSLFEYASACAEAGRVWMSGRDNGNSPARQGDSRPSMQCPADNSLLQRFAAVQH
jgi:hypothetical protein